MLAPHVHVILISGVFLNCSPPEYLNLKITDGASMDETWESSSLYFPSAEVIGKFIHTCT